MIRLEFIKPRPFADRVATRRDRFRVREKKSVVATVPGQLSANLLECLCVSLAVLSPSVHQRIGRREEKEHIYNLISLSLSRNEKGIKARRR